MHARFSIAMVLLMLLAGCATAPANKAASSPLEALFALNEMDMHLHAGMEREAPMDEWLDLAANDGRKVILLLDHLELYRKTPEEYAAWCAERHFQPWYTVGAAGHAALMADFDRAKAQRKDLIVFKGWEISEGELDTGLEPEPMRLAEVIGWHISPNNGGPAPDGTTLLKRARQVKDVQKQFPVPMILFHPFSMRIENLQRTAEKAGRDPKTITEREYRFFQPGQQEELAALLKGTSIYVEMPKGCAKYWDNEAARRALIADIKPLADAGVQFTVSTDNHSPSSAKAGWQPEVYCAPCGVTPRNTNGLVRELLAARAQRAPAKQ